MQNKILTKFLWLYIICATVAACFVYGIIAKANGDNVEHLHSSWLIWQGYVPYRDFFQHHNPLTWYLAAPFVALLINQFMIFSIFNIFSILAVCLMVYFQCRIMLVNGGKKISALFLAACVVTSYSVLWALNFRPDTFMYLCLFAGILCLCRYVREKALWLLVMSFLCFFLAFMFTQKVFLNLIVPGSFVLYWLLKGNIGGKDFLQACILPVLLFAVFAAYLWGTDYEYGTLRNKLICGHTREEVYFSNLLLTICAGLSTALIWLIVNGMLGIPLLGTASLNLSLGEMAFYIFSSLLMVVALSSVCWLLASLAENKNSATLLCLGAVAAMVIIGMLLYDRFAEPELLDGWMWSDTDPTVRWHPQNIKFIGGTFRILLEFLICLTPGGQGVILCEEGVEHLIFLPLCSAFVIFSTSLIGSRSFKKKNLK